MGIIHQTCESDLVSGMPRSPICVRQHLDSQSQRADKGELRRAGDVFYVIQDGMFTIYNDEGQELARVGKGSCFGELALLRKARRVTRRVPACMQRRSLPAAVPLPAVPAMQSSCMPAMRRT